MLKHKHEQNTRGSTCSHFVANNCFSLYLLISSLETMEVQLRWSDVRNSLLYLLLNFSLLFNKKSIIKGYWLPLVPWEDHITLLQVLPVPRGPECDCLNLYLFLDSRNWTQSLAYTKHVLSCWVTYQSLLQKFLRTNTARQNIVFDCTKISDWMELLKKRFVCLSLHISEHQ